MKEINLKAIVEAQKTVKLNEMSLNSCYPEGRERYRAIYSESTVALRELCKPVNEAISKIEGRATARTITAEWIAEKLVKIENELNIPKKYMDGIVVHCDLNAQVFPSAYRYDPESTHFTAIYKNGYWRLTDIARRTCSAHGGSIELTEEAKQAIINRITTL